MSRYGSFHTAYFTQIPYLDHEINSVHNLRFQEARNRNRRVLKTIEGLAATTHKAEVLGSELARSRKDDRLQDQQFGEGLRWAARQSQVVQETNWNNWHTGRNLKQAQEANIGNHLNSRLQDNHSRSLDRLRAVRRWH